jgi:hypothetical protein
MSRNAAGFGAEDGRGTQTAPASGQGDGAGPGASPVEGRLTIAMRRSADGDVRAQIISSRPLRVSRMLAGRTPQEALLIAPALFSLCGMAHGSASAAAFEDVLGREAAYDVRLAREIIVAAETAREHALRIMLDWPRLLGETVPRAALAGVKNLAAAPQKISAALFGGASAFAIGARLRPDWRAAAGIVADIEAFLENSVFGAAPGVWLSDRAGEGRSDDDAARHERFRRWAANGATVAARFVFAVLSRGWSGAGAVEPFFLPDLDRQRLLSHLSGESAESFVAEPAWNGVPCETGAFARQRSARLVRAAAAVHGAGLLARLTARLVELARLPVSMQEKLGEIESWRGGDGPAARVRLSGGGRVGAAQVEAARGLLVHAVELHEERVGRYWIIAPTEWNFHPRGAAYRALASLRAADDVELRKQAELILHAIDPCVAFDLKIF